MRNHRLIVFIAMILLATMACKLTSGTPSVTEVSTEMPGIDFKATENALQTMVAEQANALQTTAQANAATLAAQANATVTAALLFAQSTSTTTSPGPTEPPVVEATSTPAADSSATQQAQAFQGTIEELYNDGVINSMEGDYYRVDDFSENWAQLGYYQWWDTGYSAENFVLSTDVAWEVASDTANWPEAGCGIVFSEESENDHNLVYLSLDGYGDVVQVKQGDWNVLDSEYYGKVDVPDGEAKIMLVVDDQRINFYVNGERVANAYDGSLKAGNISETLLSGTNKDFGTRCTMTKTDLFILK